MIDGQKKEGTRVRLGDQQTKNFYQLIWPQEVVVRSPSKLEDV